ncbi:MAG TPA: GYD domain-containing protein [Vicinamibacterales bacterium]|nr:GYD domain-containing protein [Vicinamibacterales bacterium]
MPTFVLMTKLASGSMQDARGRRIAGKEWLNKVKECCPDVKWLAHYATLGPYDFMDIYEAPDVETAHKVSLLSRADGAFTAESWEAVTYDRYLQLLESVTD